MRLHRDFAKKSVGGRIHTIALLVMDAGPAPIRAKLILGQTPLGDPFAIDPKLNYCVPVVEDFALEIRHQLGVAEKTAFAKEANLEPRIGVRPPLDRCDRERLLKRK
jgi:hypothetical protein